jgi:inosose dehydratase
MPAKASASPPPGQVTDADMPPLLADLDALGIPLMAIVEHDMNPAPADVPLPIATRTCRYYRD